jgi:alkanesulfonate monooxygenase SsuD/methylene tetrahydromethanopterin reductase-like flavin-dependent oxidoreductase (luciferase family)
VPLLVGGNNDNALHRASRLGDGWHPLYPSPEQYAIGYREIDRLRSEERLSEPFLLSFSSHPCQLSEDPFPKQDLHPPSAKIRREYRYAPSLRRDETGRPMLSGSPEQVAPDLDEYRRAGVRQMVTRVWNSSPAAGLPGAMRQLEKWGELLQF